MARHDEYDQEKPQSHTVDQPMALQGKATIHQEDNLKKSKVKQKMLPLLIRFCDIFLCNSLKYMLWARGGGISMRYLL